MTTPHGTPDRLFLPIRLEPLCPVHVGTGETLSPLTYIMVKNNDIPLLHHFDLGAWIEDRPDKQELAARFAEHTWQENRSFLAKELDPALYTTSLTEVVGRSIFERYQEEIRDTRSLNQLLISEAMRSPLTKALFIPGSSVKGAIRTAVINHLDCAHMLRLKDMNAEDVRNKDRRSTRYIQALEGVLGRITNNAFQALKVGDFPAQVDDALLVEPKEVRRKLTDRASTPKNLCETTRNRIMAPDEVHELYGRMSLGKALSGKPALVLDQGRVTLDVEALFAICTEFYRHRYEAEREKFYRLPQFSETLKALEAIEPEVRSIGSNQALLRIGHYSHVECMTVTGNAPQTPVRKGKVMPFGTARTLANGVYPFGWVKISICTEGEFLREEESRKRHDREVLNLCEERRHSARQAIEKEAERLARLMAERERESITERQRQAELEAMPREERLLLQLSRDELNENRVIELYGLLESLDGKTQIEAAQALKIYWSKHDKWKVKPKQVKQYEKVCKVKKILSE